MNYFTSYIQGEYNSNPKPHNFIEEVIYYNVARNLFRVQWTDETYSWAAESWLQEHARNELDLYYNMMEIN